MKDATIIFLLLALALGLVLAVLRNSRTPRAIGLHQGELAPLPATPNAVASRTADPKRLVAPLPFAGDRRQTHRALRRAIAAFPGKVGIVTETPSYIHCVFSSTLFGFKDDVEFHLDEASRLVHFRSASRLGYSDLGVNRRRYETLAALYRRESRR